MSDSSSGYPPPKRPRATGITPSGAPNTSARWPNGRASRRPGIWRHQLSEGPQQRASDAAPGPGTMGEQVHGCVRELFPLCRSSTGDGLRATLKAIGRRIPLVLHEVPTGTPALDWQVPLEWNVRVGRIETLDGTVVVDFADCNLHVVSY